ncbi:DUF1697 domain-containing protein [Rhodococcus xishaensis]|uniref:DUF1697 domain-containing protein n=1 Tax=Rhodococcus xishaensis TaxID=2487364 RepID=A0A3S3BNR1_9NOCA|nr:DUF1697 domain-containing protein [Rhodococcus xishaensis]RVW05580.1 DUF1697 domain-containing protein [Rhodococcus xishaensis]
MARYVALLRGINVGGINIKMADLRRVFADLGFDDVKTVLASGNVLFTSDSADATALKSTIEAALRAAFAYEAWVVVLDTDSVARVVEAYPFDPAHSGRQPYVMFATQPDVLSELLTVQDALDPAIERIAAGDGVVYWEVERGRTLDSIFGKNIGKPKLKAVITTRNLRTLVKLLG